MKLDRQSIVRRDFPPERRGGYSRTAVDAHLEELATAVAELQAARAEQGASAAVSEQVATIVSAAEQAAKRIKREAIARAREHDARVAAAANALLERIDSLRAGVEQLPAELAAVRREEASRITGNSSVAAGVAAAAAEAEAAVEAAEVAAAPAVAEPAAAAEPAAVAEPAAAAEPAVVAEPAAVAEPEPEPAPAPKSGTVAGGTAVEDARLVALEMLLEGRSRAEVDACLAENFDLPDRAALLDEVAAVAGI
jgi:hypothetical protein